MIVAARETPLPSAAMEAALAAGFDVEVWPECRWWLWTIKGPAAGDPRWAPVAEALRAEREQ